MNDDPTVVATNPSRAAADSERFPRRTLAIAVSGALLS